MKIGMAWKVIGSVVTAVGLIVAPAGAAPQ
jgi:hypothetical protein